MDFAASNGHLEIIKFLHDNRTEDCTVHAMSQAAANGHLPVVQYLHGMGKPCNQKAMTDAAANGHIDVVRFLHFNRSEGCTQEAMDKIDRQRSFFYCMNYIDFQLEGVNSKDRCYEMEEAVIEEEPERHYFIKTVYCPDATDVEARNRHLQVTKFLHEHRTESCTELAMNEAARQGHLEVVQFLYESRSEGCTEEAMDCTAWKGHLEIVKSLHANPSEGCTKDAMDYAAREGHLDVVRFLHGNRSEGCSTREIDFATNRGHLDVVQFLHENYTEGCTTNVMDEAAKGGHLDVVKLLHTNRTEGCTSKAMDTAGKHGHLEIAKFLCEKGLGGSTSKALNHAAYSDDLPMVKFLDAGRGMAGQPVYMACYVRGCVNYMKHLEVIRYLYESNQAARRFLDALPIKSWDRVHEMLKHAYLQQLDARSAALQLKRAVVGSHALLVRVLCQYTWHGYLFEAKQVTAGQQHTGIAAILDAFLDRDLRFCSLAGHDSSGDVPRRCQKVLMERPPSSV